APVTRVDWSPGLGCSPLPSSITAVRAVRHRSMSCPSAVPHTFATSIGLSRTRSFSAMTVPFSRDVPQRVREAPDSAGDVAVPARRHQSHVQQVVDPAGVPGWAGEASYQFLEQRSVVAVPLLALGRDSLDELPDGVVDRRRLTARRLVCLRRSRLWQPLAPT